MKKYWAMRMTDDGLSYAQPMAEQFYLASDVEALRERAREKVADIIRVVGDDYYLENHPAPSIADRILSAIWEVEK